MTPRTRLAGLATLGAISLIAILSGRVDLWSSSVGSMPGTRQDAVASAQPQSSNDADSLQAAFIRIGQQVGPAVVSISTEQIEQVRQYFRGHPFFFGGQGGEDPFEDFFHQFYGGEGQAPTQQFHRFGLGSGVIIDQRGYILTNEHVIADADKITVTLSDGRELTGTVKGKDVRSDLAVIKVDGKKLPVATLGDSSSVKTGQWAVALGNPFGLMGGGPSVRGVGTEPTLTVGVVSALNRTLPRTTRDDRDYSGLIQTDAAINPGNSGGPLLNLQGDIVGINVAILTSSRGYEGIGFAIPVNKAKTILDALIEGRKVTYGWLGIQIQDITDDVAEYYKLADAQGVLVYQVLPDSPAQKAGLKDGDIVKAYNGQTIQHSRQLIDAVTATAVGQTATVEFLREGKRQTAKIIIGERKSETELAGDTSGGQAWRGVKAASVSQELAQQFNVAPDTKGVVVVEVEPNSPAESAGLRAGDIINEINRVRIESLSDYRQAITQVQGNALVRTGRGYVVIKAGE